MIYEAKLSVDMFGKTIFIKMPIPQFDNLPHLPTHLVGTYHIYSLLIVLYLHVFGRCNFCYHPLHVEILWILDRYNR